MPVATNGAQPAQSTDRNDDILRVKRRRVKKQIEIIINNIIIEEDEN